MKDRFIVFCESKHCNSFCEDCWDGERCEECDRSFCNDHWKGYTCDGSEKKEGCYQSFCEDCDDKESKFVTCAKCDGIWCKKCVPGGSLCRWCDVCSECETDHDACGPSFGMMLMFVVREKDEPEEAD